MPKYRPETAIAKAKKLTKAYFRNDLKQSRLAVEEGVTRQTINRKIHKKPVQDCIAKMLDDSKFKQAWQKQGLAGMSADKSIQAVILVNKKGEVVKADDEGGIMIADHNARHKYWHDFGVAMKVIKPNGNEKGARIVNIIYGYPTKPLNSSIRPK